MSSHKTLNDIEYWVYNDNFKLPVIVMVHGLRGTHHGLDLVAKLLPEFKIIIPDLPGFNHSKSLNVEHSIENYSKWLSTFISDLKLPKPPTLLGHSFGSIICASYAKDNPNNISKLILINPIGAPVLQGPRSIMTQISVFYYWLGNTLPEPIGTKLLKSKIIVRIMTAFLSKSHDKQIREYSLDQHLRYFSTFTNRQALNEAFKASISNDVRVFAPDIKVPTLLIAGDRDDVTKLPDQKKLVKMFPDAKLEVIENVGHITQYETPDEVANAIKTFLI